MRNSEPMPLNNLTDSPGAVKIAGRGSCSYRIPKHDNLRYQAACLRNTLRCPDADFNGDTNEQRYWLPVLP